VDHSGIFRPLDSDGIEGHLRYLRYSQLREAQGRKACEAILKDPGQLTPPAATSGDGIIRIDPPASPDMGMKDTTAGNTNLQTDESRQMNLAQDQMLDELLQAPLSEEGFDRLLAILDQRQRAGLPSPQKIRSSLRR